MKKISDSSIILCSIVRNAEKGLTKNIPIISCFLEGFKEWKAYIYENDSVDSTKRLLTEWANKYPQNIVLSLNNNDSSDTIPVFKANQTRNPYYSIERIEKMSFLRNKYLSYIKKNVWEADYLMVVDLDVANISMEGIISSFEMGVEWDAVTANGYSLSPKLRRRYHDSYALAEYGDEINPQTEEKILRMSEKYASLHPGDDPVRVFSAFGGLAIYRFDAVAGLRYSAIPNEDSRVEVRCEHFSIYKQMAERGYTRTYINPAMQIKYQRLTLKIIINSLKRRLVK